MRLCIDTSAYSTLMQGDREIKELVETADEVLVPGLRNVTPEGEDRD